MRKWLLLVPVFAVIPLALPMDRPLNNVRPASAVSSSTPSMDLPGLRNGDLGGAGNVPAPATPATPNPKIAQPAKPATPALPPGVTPAPSSSSNDDPCDGFDKTDARERCREDQQQFNERQFEDAHDTPSPDFRRNR